MFSLHGYPGFTSDDKTPTQRFIIESQQFVKLSGILSASLELSVLFEITYFQRVHFIEPDQRRETANFQHCMHQFFLSYQPHEEY